jgi:beta-glucosidase
MSDWGATHDSASDNANAGLDMEQPGDWILIGAFPSTRITLSSNHLLPGGGVFGGDNLKNAVNSGAVPTSVRPRHDLLYSSPSN